MRAGPSARSAAACPPTARCDRRDCAGCAGSAPRRSRAHHSPSRARRLGTGAVSVRGQGPRPRGCKVPRHKCTVLRYGRAFPSSAHRRPSGGTVSYFGDAFVLHHPHRVVRRAGNGACHERNSLPDARTFIRDGRKASRHKRRTLPRARNGAIARRAARKRRARLRAKRPMYGVYFASWPAYRRWFSRRSRTFRSPRACISGGRRTEPCYT